MAIPVGQRLGPYEITGAIGAGGMGEVYRARDTRLDRIVAIKILPAHLAEKPDRRERFEREARTIASLNHPHICTLYDVGHQNGTDYLVMEYLEGETLADRLKKGPLPLNQVLQYAIEISDALDKAHRKGITHRDLKPGNILLTKSGAKLLDFGLAKLKQEATPVASLSQRPTAESAMTAEGTILGTLQYMAPEQVDGKTNEIDGLGLTGSPVPVLEGVLQSQETTVPQYSFSSTGSLAYVAAGSGQETKRMLVWVDRKGAEQPLPAPSRLYATLRLSPDGRRVVAVIEFQTWLYDLARETLTRLTFEGGGATPIWTPDGKRIVFQSTKGGGNPGNLWWQLADGSGTVERLTTSEIQQVPGSWSPDGQALAFYEVNPTTGQDIWVLRLSDHKAEPFLRTPANEGAPQFSPDGRWLAYVSDESGRREIYVQPYPGPGGKWQISTEGGAEPIWGRNGEIFYRSGNKMVAVETTTQPTFSAGKPKVLFEGAYVPTRLAAATYDVSADGQRFVMIKEEQTSSATQINIVLNWFEELKQKVPTGKK